MIAVYAIGGGAGHVTRARRVIDALGLRGQAFILGTPSDPRAADGIPLVAVPRSLEGDVEAHRAWLATIECQRMLVDVFPAGIQGELSGFDRVPLDFIGRILRVDEYRRATNDAPWPRFETAYNVEEGAPEVEAGRVENLHLRVTRRMNQGVILSRLTAPRAGEMRDEAVCHPERGWVVGWAVEGSSCDARWSQEDPSTAHPTAAHAQDDTLVPSRSAGVHAVNHSASNGEFWLIVHSGPLEEVEELIAYARELTDAPLRVATPCDVPGRIDAFPVEHLYAEAARIVTAGGFNVMLETEPWREKHLVLPFPRRFDDQFARAARRRG